MAWAELIVATGATMHGMTLIALDVAHRACTQCDESFPRTLEFFAKQSQRSDGMSPWCIPCHRRKKNEYARASRERDPELARKRRALATRKWQDNHPEAHKASERRQALKRFGITPEEYDALLELQLGVCAICSSPPSKKALAVDHDHVTGEVRGLLCSNCNTGLGLLGDEPATVRAALQYLTERKGSL